ncbi:Transposase protein [Popillia japonica]|uniref:Transposase protein n=1 Tax=Popillia japonica TaxID=7064 RepID=A0AAW1NG04_POPJA
MHSFPKDIALYSVWIKHVNSTKLCHEAPERVRELLEGQGQTSGEAVSHLWIKHVNSTKLCHEAPERVRGTSTPVNDAIPGPSTTSTPVNDAIPGPSTEHVQQPVLMDNSFVSEQVMEEDISQESSILLCSPEQKETVVERSQQLLHSTTRSTSTLPAYQGVHKRSKILKDLGVRSAHHLSPKARKLFTVAKNLRKYSKKLFAEKTNLKGRLKAAQKFISSPEYIKLRLNTTSFNFITSQLKLQKVNPQARRFSLDDKLFSLLLLKQSPKGYRFLRKIFALPSQRTLYNLLAKVPLHTGINGLIISNLKAAVNKMTEMEKFCGILFDEISLEPMLIYNRTNDVIDGFQDNGPEHRHVSFADKAMVFMARGIYKKWKQPIAYYFNSGGMKSNNIVFATKDNGPEHRHVSFADKAMVFMARGIYKKWKQPIAYYFNSGGMKSNNIVVCLKDVIRSVRETGLKVVITVCDQGSANVKAIRDLYSETEYIMRGHNNRYFGFLVDNEEVVPLYDSPHLLKGGVRNHLVENNCRFVWRNNKVEVASWNDIRTLYDLDDPEEEFKMCHKLTNVHINNTKKMKVSVAAQVFSHRVAALMRGLARLGPQNMPRSGIETAEFLFFMDKVFDSVNGAKLTSDPGKPLRCVVSSTSPHHEFWTEAIKVFQSIEFFNEKRNHGIRNVYPSCQSFGFSFKALLICQTSNWTSRGGNCEEDGTFNLDILKDLVSGTESAVVRIPVEDVSTFIDVPIDLNYSLIKRGTLTYIAGYIARKLLKYCKNCATCRGDLIGDLSVLSVEDKFIIECRRQIYYRKSGI